MGLEPPRAEHLRSVEQPAPVAQDLAREIGVIVEIESEERDENDDDIDNKNKNKG